jgi:hypothetical protein
MKREETWGDESKRGGGEVGERDAEVNVAKDLLLE